MAYTLLDLTTAVQDDLKDSSFNATRIARYLNYAQLAIFNTHMFRFTEKEQSSTLSLGAHTLAQQSDHQATIAGVLVDPSDTNRYVVLDETNYMPHREFFAQFPDPSINTAGMPTYWTEFGNSVYFDKPADKDYTFKQRYYRTPTAMTANDSVPDVPEAFRELLELYASFRSEKYRGNHDVAATYKQEFEDGLESMNIRFSEVTQVAPVQMRSMRTRVA